MSIRDEINNRMGEVRLFEFLPVVTGSAIGRSMFISTEINDFLAGPWASIPEEMRAGRLRADLEMFVEGRLISVAEDPYKKPKSAYMARIDPPEDEVWDIRSRDPRPGIRVLGLFSEKDTFVALTYELREALGGPGSKEWRDARERCKTRWRGLFNPYLPLSRSDANEYVSNIILV